MTALILTAALKGTVLLALAWAVTALLRNSSADLRHRIWLAALCGLPLLMIPLPVPEAARVDVAYTFTATAVATTAATDSTPLWPTLWALGATLLVLRFLAGIAQLIRLTRKAQAGDNPGVRISGAISSPLTWGIVRPTILLPAYAADWSPEKRAIAIAHERAHIARGDWFWQSFTQLVNAIFWFHPLVWLASARVRSEAEHAVDDAVLSSGAEAASYAEQLLEVARHLNTQPHAGAVAMVRRPALSARISAILDATRIRTRVGLRTRVAIAASALCLAPILAAFQARPVQRASIPEPTPVQSPQPQPVPSRPVHKQAAPKKTALIVAQATPRQVPQPVPVPAPAARPTPTAQTSVSTPVYSIGDGVTAPVAIYKVEPQYSEVAREAKYQGQVWLTVIVPEDGIPTGIAVSRSLGLGLDEKAIEAVSAWRFKPAMKDGVPVKVRATIMVEFRLL